MNGMSAQAYKNVRHKRKLARKFGLWDISILVILNIKKIYEHLLILALSCLTLVGTYFFLEP